MKELTEEFEKITESKSITNIDISKIIIARLIVERLGEVEINGWWQSRVLSEFGKNKLSEMMPKTHTVNRIKLSFEVGSKKEKELIPEKEYLSLFRLTPEIEKLIDSVIHTAKDKCNSILEKISSKQSMINFESNNIQVDKINTQRELIGSSLGSFSLREIDEKSLSQDDINNLIDSIIYAWSKNKKGQLLVPYCKLKK